MKVLHFCDIFNTPPHPSKLVMDLFEFNFDGNKIDYNEILFCIHFNLKFVISSKYNVDN